MRDSCSIRHVIPNIGIPFKTRQVFTHNVHISWVVFAVTKGLVPLRETERISDGTKQRNVNFSVNMIDNVREKCESKRPYCHQNTTKQVRQFTCILTKYLSLMNEASFSSLCFCLFILHVLRVHKHYIR